ncbi:MAG: hypothetical protein LRY62_03805 [Alphaproteobacteria bacterium]|nr:hypothetical protein [Alphaproteobacteria bacterium]
MSTKLSILAEFLKNAEGDPMIRFFKDPEFVRAETIIFDRSDNSLHAVLFEQSHFLGNVDDEMAEMLGGLNEILLSTAHYKSGVVSLHAALKITDK